MTKGIRLKKTCISCKSKDGFKEFSSHSVQKPHPRPSRPTKPFGSHHEPTREASSPLVSPPLPRLCECSPRASPSWVPPAPNPVRAHHGRPTSLFSHDGRFGAPDQSRKCPGDRRCGRSRPPSACIRHMTLLPSLRSIRGGPRSLRRLIHAPQE